MVNFSLVSIFILSIYFAFSVILHVTLHRALVLWDAPYGLPRLGWVPLCVLLILGIYFLLLQVPYSPLIA